METGGLIQATGLPAAASANRSPCRCTNRPCIARRPLRHQPVHGAFARSRSSGSARSRSRTPWAAPAAGARSVAGSFCTHERQTQNKSDGKADQKTHEVLSAHAAPPRIWQMKQCAGPMGFHGGVGRGSGRRGTVRAKNRMEARVKRFTRASRPC